MAHSSLGCHGDGSLGRLAFVSLVNIAIQSLPHRFHRGEVDDTRGKRLTQSSMPSSGNLKSLDERVVDDIRVMPAIIPRSSASRSFDPLSFSPGSMISRVRIGFW